MYFFIFIGLKISAESVPTPSIRKVLRRCSPKYYPGQCLNRVRRRRAKQLPAARLLHAPAAGFLTEPVRRKLKWGENFRRFLPETGRFRNGPPQPCPALLSRPQ